MKTFLALFNLFPAVANAVVAVEQVVPLPGSGTQKLNLILGAAGAAWEASQHEQAVSKSTTLSFVNALALLTVAGLNAAGVFKTSVPVAGK